MRRQGSERCGLMACQTSMSSWKILYGIGRSVYTGLLLLQTAHSFSTTPAPPLFPIKLQSHCGGLQLWAFRLPHSFSVFPQSQA